ncbi:tyrosine-type recombinase/integrase [Flavobacterium sp. 1355]|uniref:tyrosine-type recombinase/integrase n=1 Tax=Flavobacterium sp. 1355 TaxID=2806571 RepID=UPI001AE80174|nr:site-specific integrase [Flavobacterium sp. 1355]MBP1222315.1 integrase [Flavobacterium sp. 1355]
MVQKINITLRKKPISKGLQSLYLDFYPPVKHVQTKQLTRREFLKLYLYDKPKNAVEKVSNEETLRIAELIKIRRQTEYNKDNIYSEFEKEQLILQEISAESFLDYFKNEAQKREGVNYQIWIVSIGYFSDFLDNNDITFSEITVQLIEEFRSYLLKAQSKRNHGKKLSNNSALSYFNKVKATLKKAYKEGKLRSDINAAIPGIPEKESQKNFLTIEEARKLFNTDCNNSIVKLVSLFSILTGLRYSDISKLQWSEIQFIEGDGFYIRFKQKKTNGQETLPIPQQAYELLGEPQRGTELVFKDLKKWDFDRTIPNWIKEAGISKHITFHCFRHTYATLQLYSGTDIYTLSKMLGHKNIQTTQVYTKIVDERKREASERISLY